jgi:hypothetical protein
MNKRDSCEIDNEDVRKKFKKNQDNLNENDEEQIIEEIENDDELNEDDIDLSVEQLSQLFGIRERINKNCKRFFGLIKQTPADFIVNEINLNGDIVRLDNFDLPILETDKSIIQNDEMV